jgi:SNF2 family DNA or RNA helicase
MGNCLQALLGVCPQQDMVKTNKKEGLSPRMQTVYKRLKQVRASTTLSFKPCPLLRETVEGFGGQPEPFQLRYYQVQGAYHMMALNRMVLGDACGLGKTIETLTALSYLWGTKKEAHNRVLVVAPKSAMHQWANEIQRFTKGIRPIVVPSGPKKGQTALERRKDVYKEWSEAPPEERLVLITNYALLVRDWYQDSFQPPGKDGKPDPKAPVLPGLLEKTVSKVGTSRLLVVFDEATAFKSRKTKTWEVAYFLAAKAHRAYGLTATLIKNRLFEAYCIFGVIRPGLFTTQKAFHDDYCFVELKKIGKARIPLIKGYKNLDHFREKIDPYFLGRQKHVVASELPTLTTKEITCELGAAEDMKYEEALSGVLELGTGEMRFYEDHKALVSLMYCQQVVNSLAMLKFQAGDTIGDGLVDFEYNPKVHKLGVLGAKEAALVDLLAGELFDEKVVVYTRFASLVGRLQEILKKSGIESTRITGKESDSATRQAGQNLFQDVKSGTNVIFITDAGSEAINLQAAIGMVFYDAPWSWGNYVQTLGRIIRIGSPHKGVLAFHLISERPRADRADRKTIDHHVLTLLRRKKGLVDKVLGEGAVGALKFDRRGDDLHELIAIMQGKSTGV